MNYIRTTGKVLQQTQRTISRVCQPGVIKLRESNSEPEPAVYRQVTPRPVTEEPAARRIEVLVNFCCQLASLSGKRTVSSTHTQKHVQVTPPTGTSVVCRYTIASAHTQKQG